MCALPLQPETAGVSRGGPTWGDLTTRAPWAHGHGSLVPKLGYVQPGMLPRHYIPPGAEPSPHNTQSGLPETCSTEGRDACIKPLFETDFVFSIFVTGPVGDLACLSGASTVGLMSYV